MRNVTKLAVVLSFALGTLPLSTVSGQDVRGDWEADFWERDDRVHLQLRTRIAGRRNRSGFSVDLTELTGLTAGQIDSERRSEVRFELSRDAGTLVFEGRMQRGEGWGDFSFTENSDFRGGMARLGY